MALFAIILNTYIELIKRFHLNIMKTFSYFFCNIGYIEAKSYRRILQEGLEDSVEGY